jgi:hypothetical protein
MLDTMILVDVPSSWHRFARFDYFSSDDDTKMVELPLRHPQLFKAIGVKVCSFIILQLT